MNQNKGKQNEDLNTNKKGDQDKKANQEAPKEQPKPADVTGADKVEADKKIADAQEEMKPAQPGAPALGELETDKQINEKRIAGGEQAADAGRDEATKKATLGPDYGPTPSPGMDIKDSALGRRRDKWNQGE